MALPIPGFGDNGLNLPLLPTLVMFCVALLSFPEAVTEQQVLNSQDFILLCFKGEEGKQNDTLAIETFPLLKFGEA